MLKIAVLDALVVGVVVGHLGGEPKLVGVVDPGRVGVLVAVVGTVVDSVGLERIRRGCFDFYGVGEAPFIDPRGRG